ncbi:MAG: Asp-tRNA(Asn)/Glu-tRNA(Gln) amidotransferase subunit GatA [Thermodesulfobacteriota bacterium]|nr:Asp-tRNA(Asn)/Glu-tRNA(Gln) amidotransferase subunit GatA [Thermodesulfobacteriota bacterium]
MELYSLSIHELKDILAGRKASAVEVTRSVLDRIDKVEDKINAYITVNRDNALKQAEESDRLLSENNGGPLCGIPVSLKDVLCTKGIRTTAGSNILEPFIPPYNATVVEKLQKAGAVIVGKTAMDEFAMGSTSENCAYGIPKNPWNRDYICGGSSGGSAASVAACECIASLGSDTGGSIRQPASHCGVVGIKPTYGRVSRFGLIAFASSLDQIGPFTRNVTDCALMMNAICGYDNRDSTSVNRDTPDYLSKLTDSIKGMKVGIPKEYFGEGLDPEVEQAVRDGINALKKAGAETIEISLPHTDYAVAAYYIIAPAEAGSNLARYDGVKYGFRDKGAKSLIEMYEKTRSKGFGAEVKRRIIIGTYALSSGYYDAYYKKASQVRTLIIKDFHDAFQACDILASPVTPAPAWRIGEMSDDPLGMYLSDILTLSANLAGIPGISTPCGVSKAGLPIGIQLQACHFEEEKLLRAAYNIEQRMNIPDIPEI